MDSVVELLGSIIADYGERSSTMPPHEILDVMDKISTLSVRLVDEVAAAREEWRAAVTTQAKQSARDYYDTITLFLTQVNKVFDSARSRQSMYKTYNANNL